MTPRPPTTDHRRPLFTQRYTTDDGRPTSTVHQSRVCRLSSVVHVLLALGITAYILAFTAAAWHKYDAHRMGFDLGVHEQVLWNTAQGRIAATSAFAATDSYFGIDFIPTELLLTPIYALLPSAKTLLALQVVAVALGALPVYLIVRDRFAVGVRGQGSGTRHETRDTRHETRDTRQLSLLRTQNSKLKTQNSKLDCWAGLVFAAAFLLYLPVEYTTLYEFQIRAFATTFLLWAWWAMERRHFWLFLGMVLLALGCRSEAGLVVAGMGVFTIYDLRFTIYDYLHPNRKSKIENRKLLAFGFLPVLLGLGWFVLCLQVLIPYFRGGVPSLYLHVIYGHLSNAPNSPRWLGDTPGAIFGTLITQPGFVFREVFAGPRSGERWSYLLQMGLPFGLLMLFQPRILLITLPIFALNLLSNTPNIHANVTKHYQALIVPFLVIGAAYGLHWLTVPTKDKGRTTNNSQTFVLRPSSFVGLACVLLLSLACNLWNNPFKSVLTEQVDGERIAAVQRALALVPPDAALTTTSTVGPHAAHRKQLYYFPGNVIYPREKVPLGTYLLVDSADLSDAQRQQAFITQIEQSGQYQRISSERDVMLWKRITSLAPPE